MTKDFTRVIATGTIGLPGPPGADGVDGVDGVNGTDGVDGTDGVNGVDGVNGIDGVDGVDGATGPKGIGIAVFGMDGVCVARVGAARFTSVGSATITGVIATVGTAPTGSSFKVDINKNGTTIFTTQANRPTIAISGNSSGVAIPDITSLADGDYLTVDVDQTGSSVPGSDLTVEVVLT